MRSPAVWLGAHFSSKGADRYIRPVIVLAMSISALKLLGLTNKELGIIVTAGTVVLLGAFVLMRARANRAEVLADRRRAARDRLTRQRVGITSATAPRRSGSPRTDSGRSPAARSASVTEPITACMPARIAIHTSPSRDAAPRYASSSSGTRCTDASGPSTASNTSATVISAGGTREAVTAVGAALRDDDARDAQLAQDVLEELERDALDARELLSFDEPARARGRELGRRPYCVIALRRDLHARPRSFRSTARCPEASA